MKKHFIAESVDPSDLYDRDLVLITTAPGVQVSATINEIHVHEGFVTFVADFGSGRFGTYNSRLDNIKIARITQ